MTKMHGVIEKAKKEKKIRKKTEKEIVETNHDMLKKKGKKLQTPIHMSTRL